MRVYDPQILRGEKKQNYLFTPILSTGRGNRDHSLNQYSFINLFCNSLIFPQTYTSIFPSLSQTLCLWSFCHFTIWCDLNIFWGLFKEKTHLYFATRCHSLGLCHFNLSGCYQYSLKVRELEYHLDVYL